MDGVPQQGGNDRSLPGEGSDTFEEYQGRYLHGERGGVEDGDDGAHRVSDEANVMPLEHVILSSIAPMSIRSGVEEEDDERNVS